MAYAEPMQESPTRHFNLAGASNFRDLGGYPGRDGRAVRWRQIFRSNHLGHLTEAYADVLRGLGLKSAFDLRGTEERATAICALEEIAGSFAADRADRGCRSAGAGRRRLAAVID